MWSILALQYYIKISIYLKKKERNEGLGQTLHRERYRHGQEKVLTILIHQRRASLNPRERPLNTPRNDWNAPMRPRLWSEQTSHSVDEVCRDVLYSQKQFLIVRHTPWSGNSIPEYSPERNKNVCPHKDLLTQALFIRAQRWRASKVHPQEERPTNCLFMQGMPSAVQGMSYLYTPYHARVSRTLPSSERSWTPMRTL